MAFQKLYATCRNRNYNSSLSLQEVSLNGRYTTEFFNKGQFKDFEDANIVKIYMPIPDNRFIGTLPVIDDNEQPTGETVPKLTRFVMLKYSDIYTTTTDLTNSITTTSADTAVDVFDTVEEARQRIRDNTDLTELSPGVFEIHPGYMNELGEYIKDEILIID